MKLLSHSQARRSANPTRVSSAGGHVRSLVVSSGIHLLLILSFVGVEPASGLAPGAEPEASVAVRVRGVYRPTVVFGATRVEAVRSVESSFVEPERYELVESSVELDPEALLFEDVVLNPAFETRDPFAQLSLAARLVQPAEVEIEPFEVSIAAVERQEPEPEEAVTALDKAEPEELAVVEEPEPSAEAGSSDEVIATIIMGLPPSYPKVAVRMGWEGSVLCSIEVDADGQVVSVRVTESSGYNALDEAALTAIRGWQFQAGSRAGHAARTTLEHRIHFELRN